MVCEDEEIGWKKECENMRQKLIVLTLALALLALPGLAWGDSFSHQDFGLSPSWAIGTLTHWKWYPDKNLLVAGYIDSYGVNAGGPFGISLVGEEWKKHVNDPNWTKEDAVEPLKYAIKYNGGGKIDIYYTDPHDPGYKPWRNPVAGMFGQGSNGYVDYAPEVVYALKAQGFDPATVGGPSLKYMEQHVVWSRYDTPSKRAEIERLWPAPFKVADIAKGIQPAPEIPHQRQRAWFMIDKPFYYVNDVVPWSGGTKAPANYKKDMYVSPYIEHDRTFVPVRFLAYALDIPESGIQWDGRTQTVTLIKDGTTVKLTVGNNVLLVNNQPVTMDVSPQLKGARTFLPARWVAEAFGKTVEWDESKRLVTIIIDPQAKDVFPPTTW
ncbi:MAG: stalk domain-containing protein [Bacillota bacterium]